MNNAERSMEELHPLINEAIRVGGQFVLIPKGVSMLPTIEPLKDSLVLVKAENLQKNDIILYKRKSGGYVVHRIIYIKDGEYIMCGDNQIWLEKGIRADMIIAKVSEIRKQDGRIFSSQQIRSRGKLFKLGVRRLVRRAVNKAKRLLYPIYKVIFKRNK